MKNGLKSVIAFLALVPTCAYALTEAQLLAAAKHNDYLAQGVLASRYLKGYGTQGAADYVPKKSLEACVWYWVIVTSYEASRIDEENEVGACDMGSTDHVEAWRLANKFGRSY